MALAADNPVTPSGQAYETLKLERERSREKEVRLNELKREGSLACLKTCTYAFTFSASEDHRF